MNASLTNRVGETHAKIASVDAPEAEPTEPKPKTSRINNLANAKKRKSKYNQNQSKKQSKTCILYRNATASEPTIDTGTNDTAVDGIARDSAAGELDMDESGWNGKCPTKSRGDYPVDNWKESWAIQSLENKVGREQAKRVQV